MCAREHPICLAAREPEGGGELGERAEGATGLERRLAGHVERVPRGRARGWGEGWRHEALGGRRVSGTGKPGLTAALVTGCSVITSLLAFPLPPWKWCSFPPDRVGFQVHFMS